MLDMNTYLWYISFIPRRTIGMNRGDLMARNKYPEETKQLILDVARKLFLEKGYDGTTVQDIIDGLGGLTKGVIYHHFKSKDDIFNHIMTDIDKHSEEAFLKLNDLTNLTGLEVLQHFLTETIKKYEMLSTLYVGQVLQKSNRMIGDAYLDLWQTAIPDFKKLVQAGIADGSIVTEFPDEAVEALIILSNMWIGIQLPNWTPIELKRRFLVFKQVVEALNIPIVTDETLVAVDELCAFLDRTHQNLKN